MKKFLTVLLLAAAIVVPSFAEDSFACGFWVNTPKGTAEKNVEGLALGIPVAKIHNLSGCGLALCANINEETSGFHFSLCGVNKSNSLDGCQISFVNLMNKVSGDFGVQIGFYNQSGAEGVQIGAINNGRNDATFQCGIINVNKNGLFPVMIIVNFSSKFFD